MNLWYDCEKKPITELLEFIVDNRGKTVPTTETGHILIATNCIKNDSLYPKYEKIRFLSQETYETFFRSHPLPGDIIFVNKGTPGRVCLVPEPVNFCIAQDMIALRANKKEVDNHYLFAVLRSPMIQAQIHNTYVGDVIPHFKKQFMDRLLIPIPSMSIQKRIGDIYYTLCDKIEVNRRINEQLEELAQALFKSWFVDFEPFKDGKFVESELGMIPEGCTTISLSKMANYLNGLAMQKFRPLEGEDGLPVLKIKELGQEACNETSELCSPSLIDEKYIVDDGDVIFSWSGTLLVKIWCGGTCGLNQHLFKVTSEIYPKWFVYLWTKFHLDRFIRIAKDKAVTMGHIKRGELDTSYAIVLNDDKMKELDAIMSPIIEQFINNNIEIRKLSNLRDTLLPKLMSGEIDVEQFNVIE